MTVSIVASYFAACMGIPNGLNEHNYFPRFCHHEKESAVEQRWNGQCACQTHQVVSDGNHGSTTRNGESPCQLIKQGVQVLAVQARWFADCVAKLCMRIGCIR